MWLRTSALFHIALVRVCVNWFGIPTASVVSEYDTGPGTCSSQLYHRAISSILPWWYIYSFDLRHRWDTRIIYSLVPLMEGIYHSYTPLVILDTKKGEEHHSIIWIKDEGDVQAMYRLRSKDQEIILWCEGRQDTALSAVHG